MRERQPLLLESRCGEQLTFPESNVIERNITSPDGNKKSNFIRKFPDEYDWTNRYHPETDRP